jgi:MYXO-CTERM domain-containing protein
VGNVTQTLSGAITGTNLGAGSYSTSFFTLNAGSLTFTAVPEPTSALAGLLVVAGLLRRRRA